MSSINFNSTSSALPTNASVSTTESNMGLSMNDFYELLATQLKYQDADNPMDTSEMMNQMVQMEMMNAITELAYSNLTSYAASLVDKEVTVAVLDSDGYFTGQTVEGVVTGVLLGSDPLLIVNGESYTLSQVMSVGKLPDASITVPTEPEETPDTSTDGTDTTPPVDGTDDTDTTPPVDGTDTTVAGDETGTTTDGVDTTSDTQNLQPNGSTQNPDDINTGDENNNNDDSLIPQTQGVETDKTT